MLATISFFNDINNANDRKIVLFAEDEEGVIPTSGQFSVFWGVVAPDATVVRNIASVAGTFASAGDLTVMNNIPLDSAGDYLGGTYAFVVTIKDGASIIATSSLSAAYDPRLKPGSSATTNAVASAVVACGDEEITVTDASINTGYTNVVNSVSLTPPATTEAPSPVTVTASGPTNAFAAPADGTYAYSSVTTRRKTATASILSWTLFERIAAVGSVKKECATWCSAAAALDCIVKEHDTACDGEWDLSNQDRDALLKTLSHAVLASLWSNCGNLNKSVDNLTKVAAADCGCGC